MFGETGRAGDGEEQLTVELQIYGLEALFRTCYAFTDRCYMFLREDGPEKVAVVFRKRKSPVALSRLVEDFANELINQRLRVQLASETAKIREMIVAQAFAEGEL